MDQAIQHLLESLKCVYTLSASWKILSQIWEERMRNAPRDFQIVSEIGDQCADAGEHLLSLLLSSLPCCPLGLSMMAIKQYQQATSLALEQKKYLSALRNSMRAEKILKKLFKELMKLPADKKLTGQPPPPPPSSHSHIARKDFLMQLSSSGCQLHIPHSPTQPMRALRSAGKSIGLL
jgi:hypothetical protein